MSGTTTQLLERYGRFVVEPRALKVDIPGHGLIQTSWLIGNVGNMSSDSISVYG